MEIDHIADLNRREKLNNLNKAKYEYNRILSNRAGLLIHKYKAINFSEANKAGRRLASYLKHKHRQHNVSAITDSSKATHTDKEILKTFRHYYQELYTKDKDIDREGAKEFLDKRTTPKDNQRPSNRFRRGH